MKGKNITALLGALREQKEMKLKGGIYHKTQIDLTYNSNHIEGNRLTHDQTRYIFETNTIGVAADETLNVNDIVETVNHFRCIDLIIDKAEEPPSEELCKTFDWRFLLRHLLNNDFLNLLYMQTKPHSLSVWDVPLGADSYRTACYLMKKA